MLDSDRYWHCLDEAHEATSSGQADVALEWLEKALEHNPGGAEALNGRGEILWDQQRCGEALEGFLLIFVPKQPRSGELLETAGLAVFIVYRVNAKQRNLTTNTPKPAKHQLRFDVAEGR